MRVMVRSSISGNANRPSVVAISGSPPHSDGCWKTYRTSPVTPLMPTVPSMMPIMPAASPFTIAPALRAETMAMPNKPIAAISAKPNFRMNGLMTGITIARVIAPTIPPRAETAYTAPSVWAALPLRAS